MGMVSGAYSNDFSEMWKGYAYFDKDISSAIIVADGLQRMRVEKCKFDNVIGKYFQGGGVAYISGKRMKELKIENTLFYDFKYLKSSLFVLDSE